MSSSVSVVRGRKFLNACDMWFSFMSISYMYLFRLVIFNPIKNGCPFIKHYINATSFKIIQLDARTGVLGQLAVNRKGFRAEFFSAKGLFNRVRILVGRDRNIKLFKFSRDVFYSRQLSPQKWLDVVFPGQGLPGWTKLWKKFPP